MPLLESQGGEVKISRIITLSKQIRMPCNPGSVIKCQCSAEAGAAELLTDLLSAEEPSHRSAAGLMLHVHPASIFGRKEESERGRVLTSQEVMESFITIWQQ